MAETAREEVPLRRPSPMEVGQRLRHAGETLAMRQVAGGPHRGNVPAWPGSPDLDFHGTLAALWLWTRAGALTQSDVFGANVSAAWTFVVDSWPRFVPASMCNKTPHRIIELIRLIYEGHMSTLLQDHQLRSRGQHLHDSEQYQFGRNHRRILAKRSRFR